MRTQFNSSSTFSVSSASYSSSSEDEEIREPTQADHLALMINGVLLGRTERLIDLLFYLESNMSDIQSNKENQLNCIKEKKEEIFAVANQSSNNIAALVLCGLLHAFGLGVKYNGELAKEYYQQAIQKNDLIARVCLGSFYYKNQRYTLA